MRTKVSSALAGAACKTKVIQRKLRKLLHKYKNIELQLRENSETGINRKLQSFIDSLDPLIHETKDFLDEQKRGYA
jgi:flagellar biosynthesis chaperone FliJ